MTKMKQQQQLLSKTVVVLVLLSLVCCVSAIDIWKHPTAQNNKQILKERPTHKDESVIIEDATVVGHDVVDTARDAAYLAKDAVDLGLKKADAGIEKVEHLATSAAEKAKLFGKTAEEKVMDAGHTVKSAGRVAKEKLNDIKETAIEKGEELLESGKETLERAAGAAKRKAGEVGEKVSETTDNLKESVKGTAKEAKVKAQRVAGTVKDKVSDVVGDVEEKGEELAQDAKSAKKTLGKKMQQTKQEVKHEAQGIWSRLYTWLWGGYTSVTPSSTASRSATTPKKWKGQSKAHDSSSSSSSSPSVEHHHTNSEAFRGMQAELEEEAARNEARLNHQHVTDFSHGPQRKTHPPGKETLEKTVKRTVSDIKGKADSAHEKLNDKWEDAKDKAEEKWENVKSKAEGVKDKVQHKLRFAKESVEDTVEAAADKAEKTWEDAKDSIRSHAPDKVWEEDDHYDDQAVEEEEGDDEEEQAAPRRRYQSGIIPRTWRWFWSKLGLMKENIEETVEEDVKKVPGILRRSGSFVYEKVKEGVKTSARTIRKATEDLTSDEIDFSSEHDKAKAANEGFFERWFGRKGRDTGSWLHWLTMIASGVMATGMIGLTAYYYGWFKSPYYSEYRGRVLRADTIPSQTLSSTRATTASPTNIPKRLRTTTTTTRVEREEEGEEIEDEDEPIVAPPIHSTTQEERVVHGQRTAPVRTATRKGDVSYADMTTKSSSVEDIDTALEHQIEKLNKKHWTPSRSTHIEEGGQELRTH